MGFTKVRKQKKQGDGKKEQRVASAKFRFEIVFQIREENLLKKKEKKGKNRNDYNYSSSKILSLSLSFFDDFNRIINFET